MHNHISSSLVVIISGASIARRLGKRTEPRGRGCDVLRDSRTGAGMLPPLVNRISAKPSPPLWLCSDIRPCRHSLVGRDRRKLSGC